jgi:hypothetical protein
LSDLLGTADAKRGEQSQATKPIRSPRRRAVSDQLYLLLQAWLIIVLTVVDGGQVVIQHPGWFQ